MNMEQLEWRDAAPGGGCAPMRAGDVHVWQFELTPGDDEALLNVDEHARAQRFVHRRDRDRYVAAHGWMRRILGAYIGRSAKALSFGRRSDGKPVLVDADLCFNLSHSGSCGLLAVAGDAELGVDVEAWCTVDATLADAVLSPGEHAALCGRGLDAPLLLGCWTRKEACLKALGCGLMRDPRSIDVGLDQATREVLGVELRALPFGEGYSAALAVVGGGRSALLLRAQRAVH